MRKFADKRCFNDYVDNLITGPLTTREIGALIAAGERFEPRTLETEGTVSLLRSLARAPNPEPFTNAYYKGRTQALAEALALSDVEAEHGPEEAWQQWDAMMEYANAVKNELTDRYNTEACTDAGDHAIHR